MVFYGPADIPVRFFYSNVAIKKYTIFLNIYNDLDAVCVFSVYLESYSQSNWCKFLDLHIN